MATNKVTNVTEQNKKQAIELWRDTRGHISDLCRTLGIARQTFYRWLDEDAVFAQSIADAEAELNDDMRQALIQKGADGDMTAIIFYLKSRHQDFKPQPTTLIQNNNYRDIVKEINDE